MSDIVRATRADVHALAETLTSAYEDDPVWNWLLPRERDRRIRGLLRAHLAQQVDLGRVWSDIDRSVAVVWCPPGEWQLPVSYLLRNAAVLARTGRAQLPRMGGRLLTLERRHPKAPEHWYLEYIGTHADARGTGRGSVVLSALLRQADEAGQPTYLESSNERNLSFYKRHGFALREELTFRSGPPMWAMWRAADGA